MGEGKKARAADKKAARQKQEQPKPIFDMFSEFNLAVAHMKAGKVTEAAHIFAKCFVQAQKAVSERPSDAEEGKVASIKEVMFECLVYRAACLQATQNHPASLEARSNLEKAVLLSIDMARPEFICQALDLLASIERRVYNYDGCLFSAEKLLEASAVSVSEIRFKVAALLHRGGALVGLGRYSDALQTLSEVLDEAFVHEDKGLESKTCRLLATAHMQSAELQLARQNAEKALEAAQAAAEKTSLVAQALETLGVVCLEAGEAREAAECLNRAMVQHQDNTSGNAEGTNKLSVGDGRCILHRAHAFIQLGDWATAESHIEGAVKVSESTRDEVLGANILYTAACLHISKNEVQEGVECLKKAGAVAATQKCALMELNTLVALNNIAARQAIKENFLARINQKKAAMFSEKPCSSGTVTNVTLEDDGMNGAPISCCTYVMPCCFASVTEGCELLAETGSCPSCRRHVCGLRYPGLPICRICQRDLTQQTEH